MIAILVPAASARSPNAHGARAMPKFLIRKK